MNLREAARFAHIDRTNAMREQLLTDALAEIQDVLRPQPLDRDAVEIVKLEPTFSPQLVHAVVDGVDLKVEIATQVKKADGSNKGMQWEETTVTVRVMTRNGTWVTVRDLADIGDALRAEQLAPVEPIEAGEPMLGEHDGA